MNTYKKLTGNESKYISIPASIILNTDIDYRRVVAYVYFMIKRGLDNEIDFTINSLVNWCGYIPNNNKGRINEKINGIISTFERMGFLSFDKIESDKKYKNEYVKDYYTAVFNEDAVNDELYNPSKRFALLWVDEIKKILNYKVLDTKNAYLNTSAILLVFSYIRMMIYRRSTKGGSVSLEKFKLEADNNPEAYNQFKYIIARDLGIGEKTLRTILNILQDDLQLIVMETLPKIMYEDKYRTDYTIFANTYKREGSFEIEFGEKYFRHEIECKKKKLHK